MKILHLLYESYGDIFGIGGVGIRGYEIAKRLGPQHEIVFLCRRYPGARDGTIQGIPHIFAGAESRSLTKTLLSYAAGCRRFVREHGGEFDVIVEEFSPGIPTFLSGGLCPTPVVLQLQSYYGSQYFRKYNPATAAVLAFFERVRPPRYEHFIVVNPRLLQRYRIPSGRKVDVIGNGMDEDLLEVAPGDGTDLVFLGRIDIHNKGLDVLLDAFSIVARTRPSLRLVIAGDGRDMQRFLDLRDQCPPDVRRRVVMEGWVEGEAKRRVLAGARIVVVPSRYEAQPIVTLEAMAAARALVVSPIPELRYVVDAHAGIAFDVLTPDSLAASVTSIVDDEEALLNMGARGRSIAAEHTWDSIARRWADALEAVVAGRERAVEAGCV